MICLLDLFSILIVYDIKDNKINHRQLIITILFPITMQTSPYGKKHHKSPYTRKTIQSQPSIYEFDN